MALMRPGGVPFLRQGRPDRTGIAMIGVKAGQNVAFLGARLPDLVAEVACTTGLNGRTVVVVDHADAGAAIDQAAVQAGALVDRVEAPTTRSGLESEAFDVVAITAEWRALSETARTESLVEAFRLARSGGRIVIMLVASRTGFLGRRHAPVPPEDIDDVKARLTSTGSRAVRLLAEESGIAYLEGVKPGRSAI